LRGGRYATTAHAKDSSGQTAAPSTKVRAPQPTMTIKPAVKSTKVHRGF
jgi:hypothetical protein